jgi:Ser/Thr protein kinase RdoA (MazF antagonist)
MTEAAMSDDAMTHEELLERLDRLANASLHLWNAADGASARLINLSENATYLVEHPGGEENTVLRIHREEYHTKNAIGCELAWMEALRREADVHTPEAIPGADGALIQTNRIEGLPNPRHMVMFKFIEGEEPQETGDLEGPFENLGETSARMHNHAQSWKRPPDFERLVWSYENILGGPDAYWGDWRVAPAMDGPSLAVLERAAAIIRNRLDRFGREEGRWGLIHGDIRLANLLVKDGDTRVIDFDDSGLGWFLYDYGTALSFIEDHPDKRELTEAWIAGYRRHRALSREEEAEIPTFVMMRRMHLLAWIGSHSETDLAKEQGPDFTRVSADLAEDYLSRLG